MKWQGCVLGFCVSKEWDRKCSYSEWESWTPLDPLSIMCGARMLILSALKYSQRLQAQALVSRKSWDFYRWIQSRLGNPTDSWGWEEKNNCREPGKHMGNFQQAVHTVPVCGLKSPQGVMGDIIATWIWLVGCFWFLLWFGLLCLGLISPSHTFLVLPL